ncbi:MAG: hypothetical protein Cpurp_11930 [Chlorogloea purpurea SAG 13.99]|jgi:hypothetical protein|nr:hypothetical protein [Chlorogloea purpurea SAG 13.99]
MMNTIPHLVKTSNFPFQERVIAIDTAPLSGEKVHRPGIGTMEQLKECTRRLIDMDVIDRVVEMNYDPDYVKSIYRKHFGCAVRPTHNYKGYPIFGSIFKIEACESDYMVHYDSDMMLYQDPDYSWIEEGIRLMEKHEEMMFFRSFGGPPTPEGKMLQNVPADFHPDGFYISKTLGSRAYLVKKQRYDRLLPLSPLWHNNYKNRFLNSAPKNLKTWLNIFTGKGKLDSWETIVSRGLQDSPYYRGISANPKGWTLHPIDRSPIFRQSWPEIIKKVEAGIYPPQQAGYYDLVPSAWY